ncbi:MAG: ABC transporter permease [Ruminococcaceae bacterium]|nr:ABC transporter permease [Oscillospiraceae bacterium]
MLSKRSCFNRAIFLNTLKRFWPLWFVYLGIWLLAGPAAMATTYVSRLTSLQRDILDLANIGGVLSGALAGVFSAMSVWSFMYNSKTMSGIASLPVKREGIFFSATLAGLLPAIVINAITFALCALIHYLRGYAGAVVFDLQAFAIVTMMFIFFYGFANLCAQLTGNIVILPIVFAVLNFVAAAVEAVAGSLIEVIVFGKNYSVGPVSKYLSPIVGMWQNGPRSITEYNPATGGNEVLGIFYRGWGLLAACCVVGMIMYFGALLLYRRRRMESVGDVVAVPALKPVFKYCMCFGGALFSGALFYSILINSFWMTPLAEVLWILLFMLLGAFVGYFAAEMLIHKSFRVFKGRWKGLIVSCIIVCVCVLALETDLLGIERRVPDAEDVESVCVVGSDAIIYNEPENIAAAVALHQSVVENKAIHERDTGLGSSFHITYTLKNGNTLSRIYYIRYGISLEDVEALENLQNSAEAIEKRKSLPFVPNEENFISGQLQGTVTAEELAQLNPGYSEEDLIIMNYYGYNEEYVLKQMSPAEKQQLLEEYELYGKGNYVKAFRHNWDFSAEEMWELYSQCIVPDLAEGKVGKLWIVEDEEYLNNVYSARFSIDLAYKDSEVINHALSEELASVTSPRPIVIENVSGRQYTTFYTVPTVGSRTEAWLLEHGVILHTVGEERAMSGTNSEDWAKYEY